MPNSMESHWNSTHRQPTNQSFRQQGHHPAPGPDRYQPYSISRPPPRTQDDDDNSPPSPENNDGQTRRSAPTTRQLRAMQDNKTKVKKHHCDTCPMQFERPSNLKVHQRIHTGARPFICPDCKRDFTTASNMTRHRKRIHPEVFNQQSCRSAQDNGSQAKGQSATSGGIIRVEHGGLRRQMAPESMYPGETSFERQTFGRDQSQQYASQGRSGDQSQGTMGDELNTSDHGNEEESEEEDNYDRNRRNRRRRGPK